MSVVSTQATLNLFAFSVGQREAAINTPRTLDQSIVIGEGDFIQKVPMRETDKGQATGYEESTKMYNNGETMKMSFNPPFATYNVMAFLLAYAMGQSSSVSESGGYTHTIEPLDGDIDYDRSVPTMTVAGRIGGGVQFRRCSSFAVKSLTETYEPGAWAKVSAELVGTGKVDKIVDEEDVTALDNVTSITLPTAVPGADAAERLANVRTIRVVYNGITDQYISPVSVSSANPAVVTIPSLGGAGSSVVYKVQYRHPDPVWIPFPAAISEPEIKVTQLSVNVGGSWDGIDFLGGRLICADLGTLTVTFENENLEPKLTPCAPDPEQNYAGVMKKSGRAQTVTLTREKRTALYEIIFDREEYVGISFEVQGPDFPSGGGSYGYRRVWPKCSMLDLQDSVVDGRVYETITFEVHAGGVYPSTAAKISNLIPQYAAA